MAIESDVAAHLHSNIGLTLQGAEKSASSRQRQVVGRAPDTQVFIVAEAGAMTPISGVFEKRH